MVNVEAKALVYTVSDKARTGRAWITRRHMGNVKAETLVETLADKLREAKA